MRRALWPILLAALFPAGLAQAQDPDLGSPPGAEPTARLDQPFDSYALPVAPVTDRDAEDAFRTVSGRVRHTAWRLSAEGTSTTAVMEGYRSRLADLGFEPRFACAGLGCGGLDFRFAVRTLAPPAMLLGGRDFAQLTAVKGVPAEAYASILASRVLGRIHVQTVLVIPVDPDGASGADVPAARAAPEAAGQAPAVRVAEDDRDILARLRRDGHVPVEGLVFETGGARLSEASVPALDLLARMLSRHADLSVVIVGHTDSQGGLEANLALSRERARAVRAALLDRGVPAEQLAAEGVAYLAPLTSNATAEGRARNRRVELVLP